MARFMEFVGIAALYPHWDAWTEFVQGVYGLAMSLDSMRSSHPIEVEVHHPDEISEIFDNISYAKGASVVRMVAHYIGMDIFYEGMRLYLTRHAYSNTVTNDLWQALEEVSGKPLVKFMAPWTLQVGYPIIEISDDCSIKVERYLASGKEEETDATETMWPIPVTAKVEGSDKVQGPWVINGPDGDDTEAITSKIKEWMSSSKWFKLNVDQTGFFRVAYTKEQSIRLSKIMVPENDSGLTTSDRLGIISDSFAAGKAGYSSITDPLSLIEHFGEHEIAGNYSLVLMYMFDCESVPTHITSPYLEQNTPYGRNFRKISLVWPLSFARSLSISNSNHLSESCTHDRCKSWDGIQKMEKSLEWVRCGQLS